MPGYEQRLKGRDGNWIHIGDLATSDEYWTYKVFDIWGDRLVFGVGAPQHPDLYRRVSLTEIDDRGRIISQANEEGRERAARWAEEQNRKSEEDWNATTR